MKSIAILDSTFATRKRFRMLAEQIGIEVLEASKPVYLMGLLSVNYEIGLVISELEFAQEDGHAIVKRIRDYRNDIPVLVLTADNRRASFARALQLGVSDYVLKPFEDEYLLQRVVDLMKVPVRKDVSIGQTKGSGMPTCSLDFMDYLNKELAKAQKGRYQLTVMVFHVTSSDPYGNVSPSLDGLYEEFSSVLFETDMLMYAGNNSYWGLFPFCGPEKRDLIRNKFYSAFELHLRKRTRECALQMSCRFSSFPQDGQSSTEMIMNLERENSFIAL